MSTGSVTKLSWVDTLPSPLKTEVIGLVQKFPSLVGILEDLYNHLNQNNENSNKRQKIEEDLKKSNNNNGNNNTNNNNNEDIKYLTDSNLSISSQLEEGTIIFEIPAISFQSPIRKKMNLTLHLIPETGKQPQPILSIVNPVNNVPEISITNLSSLIKLCLFLPIMGMSTISNKRNIGSLCFWLNEPSWIDHKNDPIICQVNLDLLKKHLIKTGKIPSTIESQYVDPVDGEGIKLINETIILFLQQQFHLCGINLINYLPSNNPSKNKFNINTDNAIALSSKSNTINDMVMVEAYRGSKDGVILVTNKNQFNPSYLIFGFKKPILIFEINEIENISYSEITRVTFSIIIKFKNEKVLEFSMIDQQYHGLLDEFFRLQNINDNSYDENLKEKTTGTSSSTAAASAAVEAVTGGESTTTAQGGQATTASGVPIDDDDDEEDDNYQGGEEEDDDDDVAEEYDSNAEASDGEGEDDEDVEEEEDENMEGDVKEE